MAKSIALNQTQTTYNASVGFNSSDVYSVCAVAITANGSNLTPGTRTFTAAGGTTVTNGNGAATWTIACKGGAGAAAVAGAPSITNVGEYTPGNGPTASANAATVDSGTTNATFAVTSGILKLLYTAGTNDAVVTALNAVSTDSAARVVTIYRQLSGETVYDPILAVSIPANSGTNGTAAVVDLLANGLLPGAAINAVGKAILSLAAGTKLYASVPAVTASCLMRVNLTAEEY